MALLGASFDPIENITKDTLASCSHRVQLCSDAGPAPIFTQQLLDVEQAPLSFGSGSTQPACTIHRQIRIHVMITVRQRGIHATDAMAKTLKAED
jgi:hypothetical protein